MKNVILDIYPLTPLQQGLLFHSMYAPTEGLYVERLRYTIQGKLDVLAFEKTLNAIVERHVTLRTTFAWENLDEPHQIVHSEMRLPLEILDWRTVDEAQREEQLTSLFDAPENRTFDLSVAPLMKMKLVQLSDERHEFMWSYHHILLDGWSVPILMSELFMLYDAYSHGEDLELSEPQPFKAYIQWLQQQDDAQARDFWRRTMANMISPPTLNRDSSSGVDALSTERYAEVDFALSEEVTTQLQNSAKQHRLTLNTFVQGAWALMLSRHTNAHDVTFGTVVSGRPLDLPGSEMMVGMMMNTIPVRVQIDEADSALTWLQALQNHQVEARQYEYSPLIQVHEWSGVPQGSALFESLVVFENKAMGATAETNTVSTGLAISDVRHEFSTPGYPLALIAVPGATLTMKVSYDRHQFNHASIERMCNQVKQLLEGMATELERPIFCLKMLTEAEQTLINRWNDTTGPYPIDQTIAQIFAEQVTRTPDCPAVIWRDEEVTYRELNQRANQLAHYLLSLDVQTETFVAVCMERSIDLVVVVLGIIKAGAAYVPVDPSYPSERLSYILTDVAAPIVVTQSAIQAHLPETAATVLCIDAAWPSIAENSTQNPTVSATSEHLAYAIYTSGSTGKPKGISVSHRAVCRLVFNASCGNATYINWGKDNRMAMMANITFDASVWELWSTLLCGGCLVAVPKDVVLSPRAFADFLREQKITTVGPTTALLNQVAREAPDAFQTVKNLVFGGEAVDPQWVRVILQSSPPKNLFHIYGPAESTSITTSQLVTDVAQEAKTISIGGPIGNTKLYILDQAGNHVPTDVAGELYIGGDGLARNYVNRPALTAERFVPDPFSQRPGMRLYRTGDLVRYREDGAIEFISRVDFQIKIRGHRIELGEIEAVLNQHTSVQGSAVVVREDTPEEKRIIAYAVTQDQGKSDLRYDGSQGTDDGQTDLRIFLQERLPDYMVPATVVILDSLPLNANGKVDRKALPEPAERPVGEHELINPATPVEEMLVSIWSSLLNVHQVSMDDNFFALGGHSLLATQVASRIRQVFQIELPLLHIFETPTLAALAERVESAIQQQLHVDAPPITPVDDEIRRSGQLPLSFAQQRLWFVDQIDAGNPAYNIPIAIRLSGQLDLPALRMSIAEIVKRHEVLRTTFHTSPDGKPYYQVLLELTVLSPIDDLSHLDKEQQEQQVNRIAAGEAAQGFDLTTAPLFRMRLLQLEAQEHVVLLTMHHIISDEWSLAVMMNEITALYSAYHTNQPSSLAPLAIQYSDYAHWQRKWLQGDTYERLARYWASQLDGGLAKLSLPYDRQPERPSERGALHEFELPSSVSDGLRQLSRDECATHFMTLLAALQTLLYRYTGHEDIVVGTDIANRNRLETESLIGFFVNHLLLRSNLEGRPTFRALLQQVRGVTLAAYAHQDMPFDRLVSALQPERDSASRGTLFQVLLVFGNPGSPNSSTMASTEGSKLSMSSMSSDFVLAKYDLTLFVNDIGEQIKGTWRYKTDLFDADTILQLSTHFENLLSSIADSPDSRIDRLSMRSKTVQAQEQVQFQARRESRLNRRRQTSRSAVQIDRSIVKEVEVPSS